MSDLFKFDLQRFVGGVSAVIDDATVAVEGVLPASPEAGKYYFQSNSNVGSTFEGVVSITAELDDEGTYTVEGGEYYVISSVTGITLPSDAGAGEITTGSNVGASSEDYVPISGLGNSTLTFGGTELAFTNANADAVVNIYGGNKIADVEMDKGSFAVNASVGASIYVGSTDDGNLVSIDKPFSYTAGDSPAITVLEDGANVTGSDEAVLINAPSGAGQITISGSELVYNTAAAAVISVESSAVTGFNLNATGDKLAVTAALAKNEDFTVTDGDLEVSSALPTMSAYTVEKLESAYLATGMASVVSVEGDAVYKITNNS
ncbi:MAG: hypothetical protein IJP68_11900, partial [Selenomonadaceae bacterium]|nr:hypothetical protein [Selenomonadaceae bacterium]